VRVVCSCISTFKDYSHEDKLLAIAIALLAFASAEAQSFQPAGVNPGDQFRYVFVTSTERDALSTSIADYNAFVNSAASNNAMLAGINFNVIGSTEAVDAIDNTGTNAGGVDVPIFLIDDSQIATGNADLWDGVLLNPINLDENLNSVTGDVFTGSLTNGTDVNDFGFGSGNNLVRRGFIGSTGNGWIFEAVTATGVSNNFYALSDPITVAVPEPATASILILGAIGLLSRRRRQDN